MILPDQGQEVGIEHGFFIERFGITESTTGIVQVFGAAMFFVASVRGTPLVRHLPRPRLIAAAVLVTGAMIVLQFNTHDMLWIVVIAWSLGAVAGGIRSAISPALGLSQLPDQPGSMMAARTATLQMGYLLGGLLGGAVLAWSGYAALGLILGAGMILAAVLVLRVTDPREVEGTEPAVVAGGRGRS